MGSRKQKRAAQEQQKLQNSITDGDRVMTTSGLYGTVADASGDTTIDIEIAPGVVTTWLRQAVREKVAPEVLDDNVALEDEVSDDVTAEVKDEETAEPQVASLELHFLGQMPVQPRRRSVRLEGVGKDADSLEEADHLAAHEVGPDHAAEPFVRRALAGDPGRIAARHVIAEWPRRGTEAR